MISPPYVNLNQSYGSVKLRNYCMRGDEITENNFYCSRIGCLWIRGLLCGNIWI